jgi:biotin synthase
MIINQNKIIEWLNNENINRLKVLWKKAHAVRTKYCGSKTLFRGIIEISNYCSKNCLYCGLRCSRKSLERYRMDLTEIMRAVKRIAKSRCDTVILQSGEDTAISRKHIATLIKRIKKEHPDLTITLSLGEQSYQTYKLWKNSGAERYLLKIETTNRKLYKKIRPNCLWQSRMKCIRYLKSLGYEVGSGVMVGIPGQSIDKIAKDIMWIKNNDFNMVAIGPYIKHPDTPLAKVNCKAIITERLNSTFFKTIISIVRICCPKANIPATTAVGFYYNQSERRKLLSSGANVIMENYTPKKYKVLYDIYPKINIVSNNSI